MGILLPWRRRDRGGVDQGASGLSSSIIPRPWATTSPLGDGTRFRYNAPMARPFSTVYGVDFSGARLAGKTLWVAKARVGRRLRLAELFSLEEACGCADRDRV